MTTGQVYYRYETHPAMGTLYLEVFPVVRITPRGVWLTAYGKQKFILTSAHKKFAHPTKEEALEGFIRRRERQINILTAQLVRAKEELEIAEKFSLTDPLPKLLGFEPQHAYPFD